MAAKERIGSDGQCSIGLYDISAMRANVSLLKSILQHWNHIKEVLGDSFWNRLSKGTGREEAWSYFLSLLDVHADPCSELLEYIGALTPKTLDQTGLQFVARVRPRSSLLYHCCLETLRIGDSRHDASGIDSVAASELLGIHFPSSRELLDAVNLCSRGWVGDKQISIVSRMATA